MNIKFNLKKRKLKKIKNKEKEKNPIIKDFESLLLLFYLLNYHLLFL